MPFLKEPTAAQPWHQPPDATVALHLQEGEELTHVQEVLGPPLDFLPKDIELQDLNAYRGLAFFCGGWGPIS